MEIIIIDDGSAPEHHQEIDRIAAQSPLIKVYRLPANQGVAHARNHGIAVARGDYLLFLDDDDLIHPDLLATAMARFSEDTTLDVLTFGCRLIAESWRQRSEYHVNFLFIDKGFPSPSLQQWLTNRHHERQARELQEDPFAAILKSCPAISACVIRKQRLDGCRFPEALSACEDWYFWLSLAASGARFKAHPRSYALIRRHQHSLTGTPAQFYNNMRVCLHLLEKSGMATRRSEQFNLRARLLWVSLHLRDSLHITDLLRLLAAPDLLLKTLAFYFVEKL